MKCIIKGCKNTNIKVKSRQLCTRHATQFYKGGVQERTNRDNNKITIVDDIAYVTLYNRNGVKVDVATIDASDIELVNGLKWCRARNYAINNTNGMIFMHCLIMGKKGIDHINGNGLDNRRCNLRFATQIQNMGNTKRPTTNKTGFKGVSVDKINHKFRTIVTCDHVTFRLGRFTDAKEAAWMYDQWAMQLFGEFARTNFEYF